MANSIGASKIKKIWSQLCLEGVQTLLNLFTDVGSSTYDRWMASSFLATTSLRKKCGHARKLHKCARDFINEGKIPENSYGSWVKAKVEADEDLAQELKLYLQSVGKYVKAQDLVQYMKQPDVQAKYGMEKPISLSTAKKWMEKLDYHWVQNHKGQYVDGHE
ncbi:hypothetical protein APHAL10511_006988 [Amanita phalloides]|nr:hypothetical protein APHAL10511_006988 [Amanita phalloides]